jgi:hypothetical protein
MRWFHTIGTLQSESGILTRSVGLLQAKEYILMVYLVSNVGYEGKQGLGPVL